MAHFPTLFSQNGQNNPLQAMARMQHQVHRMFDNLMNGNWATDPLASPENAFQPPCDVQETESNYLFSFDLPGLSKNDVKIEFQDNTLWVRGERKDEQQKAKGSSVRTERYYGAFERIMTLPTNIKLEAIEAQFENGVLYVVLPKAEVTKPKQIQISDAKPGAISKLLSKKEEKAA